MMKKNYRYAYVLAGVLIVALAFYLGPDAPAKNPGDVQKTGTGINTGPGTPESRGAILDSIIQNLTINGQPTDRSIVKDAHSGTGSSSSGGGGAGGASCANEAYLNGVSDYFAKIRIENVETVQDQGSGQYITYTYAAVDEYNKINGTDPDINPEDLLIVSVSDSGSQQTSGEARFTYTYLQKEEWGYSTTC